MRRNRWGGLRRERIDRMVLRMLRPLVGKTAVAARKNRLLLRLRLRRRRRRRQLRLLGAGRGPGILLQVRRLPGAAPAASLWSGLGGVAEPQRRGVSAVTGSPGGLAQTRELLEALSGSSGGRSAVSVVRRGRGRQAENRSDLGSALLAACCWFGGDLVLMDTSRVPMPHPPDRLVSLRSRLCRAELRRPFIAISPSRIGATCIIGRSDQDLP